MNRVTRANAEALEDHRIAHVHVRDESIELAAVGAILMSLSMIVIALNAQLLRRLDLRPERE